MNVVLYVTIVCDRTFVAGQNSTCRYTGVTSARARNPLLDEGTKRVVASTAINVTNTARGILGVELGVPSSLETGDEYELAMYDGTARTYGKDKVKGGFERKCARKRRLCQDFGTSRDG